jgi:hypothetical protein
MYPTSIEKWNIYVFLINLVFLQKGLFKINKNGTLKLINKTRLSQSF